MNYTDLEALLKSTSFEHVFDRDTTEKMKRMYERDELKVLYDAVNEANQLFNSPYCCFLNDYKATTEEIMTVLLYGLARVKIAKQFCKKIQYNHLQLFIDAIKAMIHPFCMSSYMYEQLWDENMAKFMSLQEPEGDIFERVVYIFLTILHLIGDIECLDKALAIVKKRYNISYKLIEKFSFTNAQKLKQSVVHLLTKSNLSIEQIHVVATTHLTCHNINERCKQQINDKAFVTWQSVINQIQKTDELLVVKDFIDRAIKATIKDRNVKETTISYLDRQIENIKNPQPTPPPQPTPASTTPLETFVKKFTYHFRERNKTTFENMLADLQDPKWDIKDRAGIALAIYESGHLTPIAKPNTFKEWYQTCCETFGWEQGSYEPRKLKNNKAYKHIKIHL